MATKSVVTHPPSMWALMCLIITLSTPLNATPKEELSKPKRKAHVIRAFLTSNKNKSPKQRYRQLEEIFGFRGTKLLERLESCVIAVQRRLLKEKYTSDIGKEHSYLIDSKEYDKTGWVDPNTEKAIRQYSSDRLPNDGMARPIINPRLLESLGLSSEASCQAKQPWAAHPPQITPKTPEPPPQQLAPPPSHDVATDAYYSLPRGSWGLALTIAVLSTGAVALLVLSIMRFPRSTIFHLFRTSLLTLRSLKWRRPSKIMKISTYLQLKEHSKISEKERRFYEERTREIKKYAKYVGAGMAGVVVCAVIGLFELLGLLIPVIWMITEPHLPEKKDKA